MSSIKRKSIQVAAAATLLFSAAEYAAADAIIYNTGDATTATVALGVKDHGELNVTADSITVNATATGVATLIDGNWEDATAPGCLCEGWGVAGNGLSASANVAAGGVTGLTLDSFASTASTATSLTHLTALPDLTISHAYMPSASIDLFEAVVTITNTSAATITDVRYTRAMDWDIPLVEFNEYVTIGGTATTSDLLYSSDNGFVSTDPFAARSERIACGVTTDFVDCGPADHGAVFDFGFGDLAAGESRDFSIFYGASVNEAAAYAALGAVGAELFSFGQEFGDPTGGTPATFIFAFAGVGGEVVVPEVPVPGSITLLAFGLLLMRFARKSIAR